MVFPQASRASPFALPVLSYGVRSRSGHDRNSVGEDLSDFLDLCLSQIIFLRQFVFCNFQSGSQAPHEEPMHIFYGITNIFLR